MRTAHLTIAHSAFHPIRRYHFLLPIAKSLLHGPCYFRPTMFVPTMTRPAALSVNSSFDSGFSGSLLSGMSASVLSSNGDYVVLSQTLQKQREAAQLASSNVATTLLRLGEHHVRNQQYDDAMDAFAEALHVRRSAYRSLVSGGSDAEAIDTIMPILSQIGNVHSLRGEHNEAMRYYNEVMSLRSARASLTTPSDSNDFLDVVGNSTRSTVSGKITSRMVVNASDEDMAAISAAINEDVSALNDLFNSISFREQLDAEENFPSRNEKKLLSQRKRFKSNALSDDEESPSSDIDTAHRILRRKSSRNGAIALPSASPIYTETRSEEQRFDFETENRRTVESRNGLEEKFPPTADKSTLHSAVSRMQYGGDSSTKYESLAALDFYKTILDAQMDSDGNEHENDLYLEYVNRMTMLYERPNDLESKNAKSSTMLKQWRSQKNEDLHLALEVYDRVVEVLRNHKLEEVPNKQEGYNPEEMKQKQEMVKRIASTLIKMGSLHYKLDHDKEELQLYYEALNEFTGAFGEDSPFVAGTRKNIGMVLAERSNFEAAIDQFQQAKAIYMSANGGNFAQNRDVASTLSCLGNVYNRSGNLVEALNRYGEALHIYRTICFGEQDCDLVPSSVQSTTAMRDTILTLKVIGMVHFQMGKLDDAKKCFEEAMDIIMSSDVAIEEMKENDARSIASIKTRIGGIHFRKGEYNEAMVLYKEAYELIVTALGTKVHKDLAGIMHHVGGVYHKRAQYPEAMRCYKESVKIYHATLGTNNPVAAPTLVSIASLHYKKKNFSKSLAFYNEALRLNRNTFGLLHPDVAPTLKSIAMIHMKTHDYKEALEMFNEFLRIQCIAKGNGSIEVFCAYKNIGNAYFKLGRFGEAERNYRHALSIARDTLGDDHQDTLSVRRSIEHIRQSIHSRSDMVDCNIQCKEGKPAPTTTPRSSRSENSGSFAF